MGRLGGDHIDQAVFVSYCFLYWVRGRVWRRKGVDREIETQFPFEEYQDLILNWRSAICSIKSNIRPPGAAVVSSKAGSPGA